MKTKNIAYLSVITLIVSSIFLLFVLDLYFHGFFAWFLRVFLKYDFFSALVTLFVGAFALFLYLKQKWDTKRDAAKSILQEIRRTEEFIATFKKHGNYQFAKKIIVTNSWNKNLHLFAGDLTDNQIDKISDFFSDAEYLDGLVARISEDTIEEQKKMIEYRHGTNIPSPNQIQPQKPLSLKIKELKEAGQLAGNPLVDLLVAVSSQVVFIYDTTVVEKLKQIARQK